MCIVNRTEIENYISALVDREASGMTDEELALLERMVAQDPVFFGEYQLDISTKLCLIKHYKYEKCPSPTADTIKRGLFTMLKTIHQAHQRSSNA